MKYDFEMDLNTETSVGKIANYIGENSKILEFGPGNGRMTHYLQNEKKCEVSIVELDKELYDFVIQFADDGFYGNIEDYGWVEHFNGKKFDYIIFADVLEHLVNPKRTLEVVREFLSEGGQIVTTFPNLAHNSVLINLFNNKLEWTKYGLLDATHVSFFTQPGFEKLFAEVGLYIKREDFTFNEVGNNEISAKYEDLPIETHNAFRMRPYGEVYQYFFALTKEPNSNPEIAELQNHNFLKHVRVIFETTEGMIEEEHILNVNRDNGQRLTLSIPDNTKKILVFPFPDNIGGVLRLYAETNNYRIADIKSTAVSSEKDSYVFSNMIPAKFVFEGDQITYDSLTLSFNYIYQGQFLMEINQALLSLKEEQDKIENISQRYLQLISKKEDFVITPSEQLNKHIAISIDRIEAVSSENRTVISGWGLNNADNSPIDYEVFLEDAVDYSVSSIYRSDVNDFLKNDSKAEFGFKINVFGPKKDKYRLILTTKTGEKYNVVVYTESCSTSPAVKRTCLRKYASYLKHNGFAKSFKHFIAREQKKNAYDNWIKKNEDFNAAQFEQEITNFHYQPKISVVVPVYNVEEKWLVACINSLRNQYYSNWELCLADDASPNPSIKPMLEKYASQDERIKVGFREKNGHISEATNTAISFATGDFIGFMDNDDELAPNALFEVVKALNSDSEIDFFYSDEDKMTPEGKRFDVFFKPNWNPELIMQHNYITHFVVIKRTLLDEIGGLKSEFNGSQDYDFVLRATERAKNIHHIWGIMYHWRAIESSTALNPESKNYAYVAGQHALEAAVKRRGLKANVAISEFFGCYKIDYLHGVIPKVSIVVNNYGSGSNGAVEELLHITNYPNFEIILPQKGKYTFSTEDARLIFLEGDLVARISQASGEYVVLIDGGIIPQTSTWLKELLNYGLLDGVGVVTGKIFNEHNQIINIGVSVDAQNKKIVYPEIGVPSTNLGYYYRVALPRSVQAATEDVMLFKKSSLNDDVKLNPELGNQLMGIDLCMQIAKNNNERVVYTSYAKFKVMGKVNQAVSIAALDALFDKWTMDELSDPYGQPTEV